MFTDLTSAAEFWKRVMSYFCSWSLFLCVLYSKVSASIFPPRGATVISSSSHFDDTNIPLKPSPCLARRCSWGRYENTLLFASHVAESGRHLHVQDLGVHSAIYRLCLKAPFYCCCRNKRQTFLFFKQFKRNHEVTHWSNSRGSIRGPRVALISRGKQPGWDGPSTTSCLSSDLLPFCVFLKRKWRMLTSSVLLEAFRSTVFPSIHTYTHIHTSSKALILSATESKSIFPYLSDTSNIFHWSWQVGSHVSQLALKARLSNWIMDFSTQHRLSYVAVCGSMSGS